MCGICGILRLNRSTPPWSENDHGLLDRMTDSLAHRGPNDRDTWFDDHAALGHRRLSVIDLSRAGRQPMSNEDGSLRIVFGGEIYNFRELKEEYELLRRGHLFRSRTDTEVLLHLYEEIGLDMVAKLNGMFAMALWDGRTRQLHLIRDPYGVKPLFYQVDRHYLRFASEIKAILVDPRVPRKPSRQALYDYLTFDYIPGAQTAFEGIYEVRPAHWITIPVDAGADEVSRALQGDSAFIPGAATKKYWQVSWQIDDAIDEATAVRRAGELMDQAVERQLVANVPVGVLLSGGMDSSALVALMARHRDQPVHTYSVGFDDASFNELPYARIVAQAFKTVPREVIVTPDLVRAMLPNYLRHIDEPYADGSAIPTYYVCELAKNEVVVVLSGEGGDEAFAGYETYAAFKATQWARIIPRWLRRGLIAPLVNRLPVSERKLSLEFKLKRFLGGLDLSPPEAHVWWRVVLTEARKREICSAAVQEGLDGQNSDRHFLEVYNGSSATETLGRIMDIDSAVFMPDDLMVKNDRMSMAHSLEARVPFTDPDLTEFMSRVPARLKLPGLRKKHLMRRALSDILPAPIINKKKVGLEMPYSRWLKNELHDVLMRYCNPEAMGETGLFRPEGVRRLLEEHLSGAFDHGRALWGLLNYMMWWELYIA